MEMSKRLLPWTLVTAATVTALGASGLGSLVAIAQQDAEAVVVAFSDPSRPGKVTVELLSAGINVKGQNRKDVSIVVRRSSERPTPRGSQGAASGLRRLTQTPGFSVEEERNSMKIESATFGGGQGGVFELLVPLRTDLKLSAVNGGPIVVDGVEGDLEIENVNGPVTLTNVAGSVVANSVNGGVNAKLTRVTAQKAMAFTSLNGPVDVTLPASVKANFKLRSDQGEIFTDFELQTRPAPGSAENGQRSAGRLRLEVNRSLYGAVNGGGPEIEMRTFNGSVFLRKGSQ